MTDVGNEFMASVLDVIEGRQTLENCSKLAYAVRFTANDKMRESIRGVSLADGLHERAKRLVQSYGGAFGVVVEMEAVHDAFRVLSRSECDVLVGPVKTAIERIKEPMIEVVKWALSYHGIHGAQSAKVQEIWEKAADAQLEEASRRIQQTMQMFIHGIAACDMSVLQQINSVSKRDQSDPIGLTVTLVKTHFSNVQKQLEFAIPCALLYYCVHGLIEKVRAPVCAELRETEVDFSSERYESSQHFCQ